VFPGANTTNRITATTSDQTNQMYRTRVFFERDGVSTFVDSSTQRIRFEPRYYYGVSNNPTLGANLTGILSPSTPQSKPSQVQHPFSLTLGTPAYMYFAYPNINNSADSQTSWNNSVLTNVSDVNPPNLPYTSQFANNRRSVSISFPTKPNLTYIVERSDLITPTQNTTITLRFNF
jgi:hypothetical protein